MITSQLWIKFPAEMKIYQKKKGHWKLKIHKKVFWNRFKTMQLEEKE